MEDDNNDNNNPWSSAASTNESASKTSFRISDHNNSNDNNHHHHDRADDDEESIDPEGCGFVTLYKGLQLWHGLDLFIGILMIVYAVLQKSHVPMSLFLLALLMGLLVTLRALVGTLALAELVVSNVQRLALQVSAGTSPLLACTWFVLTCMNGVVPGHVRRYLQQHGLLWKALQQWENSHYRGPTLTLILFGVVILECVRWQLIVRLIHQLERLELQEEARERRRANRQISSPHRPWWWQHKHSQQQLDPNDPLTDSLLPVTADRTGEDYDSNRWSFFGRKKHKRRNNNTSSNVRDDASVDFASVQEEWASRAEEDPYWWSRDGEEDPPTREVSWRKE